MRFANDFQLLTDRLNRDPKIVIHGNSCIVLYIIAVVRKLSLSLPAV